MNSVVSEHKITTEIIISTSAMIRAHSDNHFSCGQLQRLLNSKIIPILHRYPLSDLNVRYFSVSSKVNAHFWPGHFAGKSNLMLWYLQNASSVLSSVKHVNLYYYSALANFNVITAQHLIAFYISYFLPFIIIF